MRYIKEFLNTNSPFCAGCDVCTILAADRLLEKANERERAAATPRLQ